jgi:ribose 5-phosphate isomerase B
MKIAYGTDHAAAGVREKIIEHLKSKGHEVIDYGSDSADSCDYPDFASQVARAVSEGTVERGILSCGTGIGMSITANKFKGVRAAVVHDEYTATVSRSHNDANVLCIGARVLSAEQMIAFIDIWLTLNSEGGRHERRVQKIAEIENENLK